LQHIGVRKLKFVLEWRWLHLLGGKMQYEVEFLQSVESDEEREREIVERPV
jgi:hypothetical protein